MKQSAARQDGFDGVGKIERDKLKRAVGVAEHVFCFTSCSVWLAFFAVGG